MNIPKELIEQWLHESWAAKSLSDDLYIAQKAVEWERERLSKIAGEPGFADMYGVKNSYTQDQLLGAIVRAEDAMTPKYQHVLGLEKQVFRLESQLAQCKEDAERWREWFPWISQLNKKPFKLHKLCDQINAARKEQA